jgi:hypothetical protein
MITGCKDEGMQSVAGINEPIKPIHLSAKPVLYW